MNSWNEFKRKWAPSLLIALIIGGNIFSFLREENYWPFSSYPMYSKRVSHDEISWVRLYAIYENQESEVMLSSNEDTYPMTNVTFSWIAVRLIWAKDQDRLRRFLNSLLTIHNERFPSNKIRELKLYWGEWDYPRHPFDPKNPDRRRLVSHVANI